MTPRHQAQAAKADIEAVKQAFLRATMHLARVDEQVFAHMRTSGSKDVVDQILPLTLDALRPLVEELTSALSREAKRIAGDAYLGIALRTRKAERLGHALIEKDRAQDEKPQNPFSEGRKFEPATIRRDVAKLVVDIGRDQRKALKKVIARRFDPDSTMNDVLVKDIKAVVGLTEREAIAVMNFRDSLTERALASEDIDKHVERYSKKLHQARAERIARTETVRVETAGRLAGWHEAQKDGFLSKEARVEWVANSAACDECRPLDGKTAALKGGSFDGPEGQVRGPPLHPHCECDLVASDEG